MITSGKKPGPRTRGRTRAVGDRFRHARRRWDERTTIHHRRFYADVAILAVLLFCMGCLWFTVARWIAFGALLMLTPKMISDAGRLLDVEIIRDRLGMKPERRGRHAGPRSAPIHTGAHPRPGARSKG